MLWKKSQITQLTDKEGLVSNMIEDVHVDDNNILWVGTLNGLNKVTTNDRGEIEVRQFTMSTGLPSNEIYKIKSYKGQVWLCTGGGLVKFQEHPMTSISPKPILQKIEINQNKLTALSQSDFTYQENSIKFHFLTINYQMYGRIPYRFRLNEAEDWQYTKNLSINYPALTPGEYQFEVQAQNEERNWSESTSYAFKILPPWWETNWARLLFSFCFLTIVIKGNQAYHSYKLQRVLEKQLARESERDRIAADLHDGMGKEISRIKMKLEQLLRKAGLLNDTTNFEVILQRMGGLHKQLQDIIWATNTNYDNLESLMNRMREETYSFLGESAIRVDFLIKGKIPDIEVNSLFRQNLVYAFQEILNNAYKHSQASKMDIKIQFKKKYLNLIIKDNGTGFNPDAAPKGTGNGIPNIKNRINRIGGTIKFHSDNGTTITMSIPYNK